MEYSRSEVLLDEIRVEVKVHVVEWLCVTDDRLEFIAGDGVGCIPVEYFEGSKVEGVRTAN